MSIAASSAATGFSIWATHFVAMLGYEPGVPVTHALGPTLLSLLVAITTTSLGLATAIVGRAWWAALIAALSSVPALARRTTWACGPSRDWEA